MSPEVVPGAEEEDRELSDLVTKVLDIGGDVPGVVDLCRPPPEEGKRRRAGWTLPVPERRIPEGRVSDLYVPSLTQMMSLYLGFFPARQSLQNQLPSGMAMFRQSG